MKLCLQTFVDLILTEFFMIKDFSIPGGQSSPVCNVNTLIKIVAVVATFLSI